MPYVFAAVVVFAVLNVAVEKVRATLSGMGVATMAPVIMVVIAVVLIVLGAAILGFIRRKTEEGVRPVTEPTVLQDDEDLSGEPAAVPNLTGQSFLELIRAEGQFNRMDRVGRVVTHFDAHPDEAGQMMVAAAYGRDRLPGITKAEFAVHRREQGLFEGKTWQEHWLEGTLLLGCGGGPFDEHALGSDVRKAGESGLTLMTKWLGVDDKPELKNVRRYILGNDNPAAIGNKQPSRHGPTDLAARMRRRHKRGLPQEETFFLVVEELEQWRLEELDFVNCEGELARLAAGKTHFDSVQVGGQNLTIAGVEESDNPEMARYLRSLGADIVVLKSRRGNTLIQTDQKYGLKLDKVAMFLRMREAAQKGVELSGSLDQEGMVDGAEEWYLPGWDGALFNGSRTAPDVPPTKISTVEIIKFLKLGLHA